ncbi:hypothetical protein HAX54_051259 [Datura stramonium]|uniref:BAH domain-containing protein n=1 Tax=Datura stramonium TaxID=4076 RepID=A0ABS8RUM5_DATST|nr:hypothetical protein [Datura stramonium]
MKNKFAGKSNLRHLASFLSRSVRVDATAGVFKAVAQESIDGQLQFHGLKELFMSDHYDIQSVDTIEDKCTVHTFKSYTKLDAVGNEDFFCRFEYNFYRSVSVNVKCHTILMTSWFNVRAAVTGKSGSSHFSHGR